MAAVPHCPAHFRSFAGFFAAAAAVVVAVAAFSFAVRENAAVAMETEH